MTASERTGWRDRDLSARHRRWGFNCPAVDLDFLMVEYNLGEPAAIVEYKHHRAAMPDFRHPTYRAIQNLADRQPPLPFMVAFYWPGAWAFEIHPLNDQAMSLYGPESCELTEREFVTSLYRARSWVVEESVLRACKTVTVQEAAAAEGVATATS